MTGRASHNNHIRCSVTAHMHRNTGETRWISIRAGNTCASRTLRTKAQWRQSAVSKKNVDYSFVVFTSVISINKFVDIFDDEKREPFLHSTSARRWDNREYLDSHQCEEVEFSVLSISIWYLYLVHIWYYRVSINVCDYFIEAMAPRWM